MAREGVQKSMKQLKLELSSSVSRAAVHDPSQAAPVHADPSQA